MVAKEGVSTSMSAELMHKMNPYGYKKFCEVISEQGSISLDFYKASKWVNYFTLDTSLTFKNGKVNPDHVYELFSSFNVSVPRKLGTICWNMFTITLSFLSVEAQFVCQCVEWA